MDKRTFTKAQELFRHLTWLEEIARNYEYILRKTKEDGAIEAFVFRGNDDGTQLTLNPHRPIKPRFVIDGLKDVLADIKAEIKEIEKKIAAL